MYIIDAVYNNNSKLIYIFLFKQGAAAGMISSHAMTLFIVLGSLSIAKEPNYLPVSTEGCTNTTFSPHIEPIFDVQYNQYKMSFINKTHDEISSILSTPEVESSTTEYA